MRLRLIAAALLAALPAWAQEEPIQSTITAQIEAFRASDFETAFTYASPSIKQMFRTPANFGSMVVTGYPMVVNPAMVEMQDLRTVAGALWQRVRMDSSRRRGSIAAIRAAVDRTSLWRFRRTAGRPGGMRLALRRGRALVAARGLRSATSVRLAFRGAMSKRAISATSLRFPARMAVSPSASLSWLHAMVGV